MPDYASVTDALEELARVTVQKQQLLADMRAIRDLAFRGAGSPTDALDAIHARACRAVNQEN